MDEPSFGVKMIVFAIGLLILMSVIALPMWLYPKYRLYSQDLKGEANLRQQEWEKKIAIEEARALKDSAVLKAEAEIERAKGVAEANRIIADGLKQNEEYLRYLWIDSISNTQNQIIYVPTEAGLPVLEAGKR